MKFIDTHTHLYIEEFSKDRDQVIANSIEKGVQQFYLPAICSKYIDEMQNMAKKYPDNITLMAGLHPSYVKEDYLQELDIVEHQLINSIKKSNSSIQEESYVPVQMVGEIGIDLYWDTTYKKQQQHSFEKQVQWAKQYELPIAIHCREAFDEVFEILEKEKSNSLSGIFHCFTGNLQQAQKAIELGLHLGIGGVVTFKNGKIDQFINQIPLSSIVLETDAPYLAPKPFRGKRNESAYLVHIAEKLATLYNCSLEEVAKITTRNAEFLVDSSQYH